MAAAPVGSSFFSLWCPAFHHTNNHKHALHSLLHDDVLEGVPQRVVLIVDHKGAVVVVLARPRHLQAAKQVEVKERKLMTNQT